MKKCSTCGRAYGDANLAFCTEDGGSLIEVNDQGAFSSSSGAANEPPPTVFSIGGQSNAPFTPSNVSGASPPPPPSPFGSGGRGYSGSSQQPPPSAADNVYNLHQSAPPNSFHNSPAGGGYENDQSGFNPSYNVPFTAAPAAQKSKVPVILGGLVLLAFLGGLAIIGVAGFILYKNSGSRTTNFAANKPNSYTPPASNTNSYTASNTNRGTASNTNRGTDTSNPSSAKTFDSLRQRQLGSFKLDKIEKTDYMKIYPNLEEESLTYVNSAGKRVLVNKTRFPSRAEAERVLRDMVKTATDRGSQFTPIVAAYSNDGREVGLSATRTGDKGGVRNYTIYFSQDNVVTFMFNLENDKAAVDEIFKYSEY